jgi:hypothetical protein
MTPEAAHPRTAAGRALLADWNSDVRHENDALDYRMAERILAIEAEAAAGTALAHCSCADHRADVCPCNEHDHARLAGEDSK